MAACTSRPPTAPSNYSRFDRIEDSDSDVPNVKVSSSGVPGGSRDTRSGPSVASRAASSAPSVKGVDYSKFAAIEDSEDEDPDPTDVMVQAALDLGIPSDLVVEGLST